MTRLLLDLELKRIVIGIGGIFPNPEIAVIRIDDPTQLPAECTPDVVNGTAAHRQVATRYAVDVIRPEEFVCCGADVIQLDRKFRNNLVLCTQIKVVNVRISDSLRENNSGQKSSLWVSSGPAREVADRLRADTLTRIRWRTRECWSSTARAARRTAGIASGGTINDD